MNEHKKVDKKMTKQQYNEGKTKGKEKDDNSTGWGKPDQRLEGGTEG